jgi:hypothetical protein
MQLGVAFAAHADTRIANIVAIDTAIDRSAIIKPSVFTAPSMRQPC